MAEGPGVYDPECTQILQDLDADLTVLVVANGTRGSGFSISSRDPRHMAKVPTLFRAVADQVEADLQRMFNADH